VTDNPIDGRTVEGLASSFGGGAEGWAFVRELLDSLLEETPAELATLRNAVEQSEAGEARRVAHTLKTHGATFGAGPFTEICRELEAIAKADELDGSAVALVDRAELEWGRASTALERFGSEGAR
jgi:HPt (histidine-containing phosphotransfer) domain-containing protein